MLDSIKDIQKVNSESYFTKDESGYFWMDIPVPQVEIKAMSTTTISDLNGNIDTENIKFIVNKLNNGKAKKTSIPDIESYNTTAALAEKFNNVDKKYLKITDYIDVNIYYQGNLVAVNDIYYDQGNDCIRMIRTLEDLGEGVKNMGESMAEGQGWSYAYSQFYPAKTFDPNVDKYYGAGVGLSKIYRDTNIISCNKHDWDTSYVDKVQFALARSDCRQSIILGVSFLLTPILFAPAYMSANCVVEIFDKGPCENTYCNGKLGSDGKTNCSWFNGINHSESFHTHVYYEVK